MLNVVISEHATHELRDIYHYSKTIWGERKAKDYLLGLNKTMNMLAEAPNIALEYEDDIYYFPSQSHIIYFIQQPYKLFIVTVLHKSRLPSNDPILHNI